MIIWYSKYSKNLTLTLTTINKYLRVNGQIRAPQVMVIDHQGKQLGVLDTFRAVQLARDQDLDLVEVSPVARPPVCKIMNYGAYQYQQEKKVRKLKAKQKKVEIKGLRLGLNIGAHDLEIRKNQALKFFAKGDKVKVELILRGRERAFMERAKTILHDFVKSLGEDIVIEQPLTRQGGRLSLLATKR